MKTLKLESALRIEWPAAHALLGACAKIALVLFAAYVLGLALGHAGWSLPTDPALAAAFTA